MNLKWYQVREQDGVYKFGIFWIYPNRYPFWKYLLPFVSVVEDVSNS